MLPAVAHTWHSLYSGILGGRQDAKCDFRYVVCLERILGERILSLASAAGDSLSGAVFQKEGSHKTDAFLCRNPAVFVLCTSSKVLCIKQKTTQKKLLQKCVGGDVYWRVLWLLPTVPLLAYGGTALIYGSRDSKSPTADEPKEAVADGQKETADVQWQSVTNEREAEASRFSVRILLLVLLLAGIVVSGKSLMDAGFYERVHNFQKVPDEAAQICDFINKQKEEGEVIYLAADDNIAAYVRVYDPSILMPYGRGGKGRTTQAARKLYTQLTSGMPVIKKVVKYAKSLECNYLVFPLPSQKKQDYMAIKGYFLIGQVNSYGIFKYVEPNE